MKKEQVKIGGTYLAKVTDKVVPVRLDKENPQGGWDATNLATNKKVRIKSAQRLRGPAPGGTSADVGTAKMPVKKKLTKKELAARRANLKAQHKADQENARLRDERETSDDGMTASERAMATSVVPKPQKNKKASGLDVAAQVLKDAGQPMRCKDIVQTMLDKGLWSTGGKTPHATIYAAILREIQTKGDESRFRKVERGLFTLAKGA